MRPVKLTFAGLRSYRAETVIDFTKLDLFAVIGDTGAGKSTILEAFSLALYARKSWSGGAGIGDVIADGENTMRIELTFIANGHTWTVTRARHRNNSKPVDKLTSSTGGGPNVDGSREVTDTIMTLLGLSHDQFTRAVVLPQGKFDLLLQATAGERTKVLSSLLGLDDVVRTRVSVDQLKNQWAPALARYRERRQNLPADPTGELADAIAAERDAAERLDLLQRISSEVTGLAAGISGRAAQLERLSTARSAIPPTDGANQGELMKLASLASELDSELSRLDLRQQALLTETAAVRERILDLLDGFAGRDDLVAARGTLQTIVASIDTDIAAAEHLTSDHVTLLANEPDLTVNAALTAAVAAAEETLKGAQAQLTAAEHAASRARDLRSQAHELDAQLEALDIEHGDRLSSSSAAELALDDARRDAADASAKLTQGRADLRDAELADAAASVAATCAPGDPCPICARPLPDNFIAGEAADLAGLRTWVDSAAADAVRATATVDVARDSLAVAVNAVSRAEENRSTVRNLRHEVEVAAQAAGVVLANTADETVWPLLAAVNEAIEAVGLSRAARDDAIDALSRDRADRQVRGERYAADVAKAAAAAGEAAKIVDGHRQRLDRLPANWRADTLDARGAWAVELAELSGMAASTRARKANEVFGPTAKIVAAINARNARVRDLAVVLSAALRDSNFVGHLVTAREHELLTEASRRLRSISGGRFGFVADFGVVSINSGEVRSPDTLSGGERFQAALALALALVEIASRGGGRLDAVFIDEGFGSLDAHALDVALETLGTVSGAGKMVALISHLQPVADYVDTVLHVTKDDLFGSRIDVLAGDAREQLIADDLRSRLAA